MNERDPLLTEVLKHPLTWLFSGGGLTLLINHLFGRRKVAAEAKQVDAGAEIVLSKGAIEFANELRRDIDKLQQEIHRLNEENRELFRSITSLQSENKSQRLRIEHLESELVKRDEEIQRLRAIGGH